MLPSLEPVASSKNVNPIAFASSSVSRFADFFCFISLYLFNCLVENEKQEEDEYLLRKNHFI